MNCVEIKKETNKMATVNISQVSEEVENYLRLHLLLNDISPKAVRIYFDKEFSPTCLHATMKKGYNILIKTKGLLNKDQKNLILPINGMYPICVNY